MSLHGSIDVNGHPIGWWAAQRVETGADGLHTYRWQASTDEWWGGGMLEHQMADGALVLAQKVLVAAHRAMAEAAGAPVPASPEVAAAVKPYADALAAVKPEWQVLREAAELVPMDCYDPRHIADLLRAKADRLEAEAKGKV